MMRNRSTGNFRPANELTLRNENELQTLLASVKQLKMLTLSN